MPTYDYRCETNGELIEVKHKMSDVIKNWGELCQIAGISAGETPLNSPVTKLVNGGQVVNSRNLGESASQCGNGSCGMRGSCEYG
ncbi:MAG: zinc ribbon domain-containing protein [Methylococcales bacterium]|jgi:hypothetical protein|nr:zinc ribbon domain-containing protein [Methylococcales bacterium]